MALPCSSLFGPSCFNWWLKCSTTASDAIRGCTDAEVRELERQLSIRFPAAMSECLHQMGHECGDLFDGDAFGIGAFNDALEVAVKVTTEVDSPWRLADNVIPFLQHQGYEFLFLYSNAGDDPPVWLYIETEPEPKQVGLTFTAWLRESAIGSIEGKPWNNEVCREIRLHRDDWIARKKTLDEYTAEANRIRLSLIRRLIQVDRDRGRITGPNEMQQIWNREVRNTDLGRKLIAEGKRIPWGWFNPSDA